MMRSNRHGYRLVGHEDPESAAAWNRMAARSCISEENLSAARIQLGTVDPRWKLAQLAYDSLKRGPISPEQREGLVMTAGTLGLRPFDASLIIAIAQDHARTGRSLAEAAPTLRLVHPVPQGRNWWTSRRCWSITIVGSLLVALVLIALA